jgi:Ca-activated chloride channel homolog
MPLGRTALLRYLVMTLLLGGCALVYAQDEPDLPPRTVPPPVTEPTQQPQPTQQPPNAQQPGAQPQGQAPNNAPSISAEPNEEAGRFVFKKEVEEVVLHATVTDAAGHLVTQLDRSAFSISQNGIPQTITSFRREDTPVAMGILIDNSGSMRDKRAKISNAVMNLIRASNSSDEIFVVNFGQTPYLDQDFTSDPHLLEAALHQSATRGTTALYDAVVASAVHLQNNPRLQKKVLLVVTDGQDNMSRETLQEAIRKLQPNRGLTVYAIGLTDEGFTRKAHDALYDVAITTGGVAYFPQNLDEVDTITRTVAHDIRSQYTLAFRPANPNASRDYLSLKVEARAQGYGRLTVRTRTGYFPGENPR